MPRLGNYKIFQCGSADRTLGMQRHHGGLKTVRGEMKDFFYLQSNLDFILLAWEATKEFKGSRT